MTAPPFVWVVDSGDYSIDGVYASLEDAVAGIKAAYPSPYVVAWEPLQDFNSCWELVGQFDRVAGCSVARRECFTIRKFTVQPMEPQLGGAGKGYQLWHYYDSRDRWEMVAFCRTKEDAFAKHSQLWDDADTPSISDHYVVEVQVVA